MWRLYLYGNPTLNHKHSVNIDAHRDARLSHPTLKDWSDIHESLPPFPFFSVGRVFKDVDDDTTALKKKITALEESQKEVLELLKEYITVSKTLCNDEAVVTIDCEQAQEVPEAVNDDQMKPGASDIADDKNEGTSEGSKKNQAQSISATINGDSTGAVTAGVGKGSAAPSKEDEKKETAPKNDDAQTHAVLNGNEENETTEGNGEKAESTERPGKVENSDATQELVQPQYNLSMEKDERPGSLENNTTDNESNTPTVHQDSAENGTKVESNSEGAEETAPFRICETLE